MSGPILDLPLQSWSWEEDKSRSTLVDGNMEAVGTAAWSAYQNTPSKQSGTPHGGTQCLRMTRTTGITYFCYQDLVTYIGAPHRLQGYMRSDGSHAPSAWIDTSVAPSFTGTVSGAWQGLDFIKLPSGNRYVAIGVYNTGGSAGYVEADDFVLTPFIARTKNVGSLRGSVELGNGLASSSFPTQIAAMQSGMIFNSASSQVLQWFKTISSGTYTVALTLQNFNSLSVNGYLFDARDSGGTGYALLTPGNLMGQSSGSTYFNGRSITVGVDAIPYGAVGTIVCAGITIATTTKLVIGASSGIALPWNGRLYHAAIYPGTLTQTQAKSYHERQMMMLASR